jgi:hypothetical protein
MAPDEFELASASARMKDRGQRLGLFNSARRGERPRRVDGRVKPGHDDPLIED